jgi:hypothetical protein
MQAGPLLRVGIMETSGITGDYAECYPSRTRSAAYIAGSAVRSIGDLLEAAVTDHSFLNTAVWTTEHSSEAFLTGQAL